MRPDGSDRLPADRTAVVARIVEILGGSTASVAAVAAADFDAVFLSGGHGATWDLATSDPLAALLGRAWADGKVVAAVCHGPAGLVNVRDAQSAPIVRDRRVAGFSGGEGRATRSGTSVPFPLGTGLRGLGGKHGRDPDSQPFAIADGQLVTGQNPPSSARRNWCQRP